MNHRKKASARTAIIDTPCADTYEQQEQMIAGVMIGFATACGFGGVSWYSLICWEQLLALTLIFSMIWRMIFGVDACSSITAHVYIKSCIMNRSQIRGFGIMAASLLCIYFSLLLNTTLSVRLLPLIFGALLLLYGSLLVLKKLRIEPKPFSSLNWAIGFCVGVTIMTFFFSLKNRKQPQHLRQLEEQVQDIKKHPR